MCSFLSLPIRRTALHHSIILYNDYIIMLHRKSRTLDSQLRRNTCETRLLRAQCVLIAI